jgi:hypothetical protein
MLARRLLILVAVLMGLTALAAGVSPRAPVDTGDRPPATPTRSPQPVVEETLRTERSGQNVVAREGQQVVITVEGDELDTVTLAEHGNETVERDIPARFELRADIPGTYEISLEQAERVIGTLEVLERDAPAAAQS